MKFILDCNLIILNGYFRVLTPSLCIHLNKMVYIFFKNLGFNGHKLLDKVIILLIKILAFGVFYTFFYFDYQEFCFCTNLNSAKKHILLTNFIK